MTMVSQQSRIVLKISAIISASEDPLKVIRALKNVVGGLEPSSSVEKLNIAIIRYKGDRALQSFFHKIRDRQIISTARRLLLENLDGKRTQVMLNRQAAFAENIVLCEEETESPLGPILLEIGSPEILRVIDWLAPDISEEVREKRGAKRK
jgi:predicted RNA binding protein with dsRBD fold (UPF0201 family)